MIDARNNPYVLQFLGLSPPPFAADLPRQAEAAAPAPVYRPLVVQIQAPATLSRVNSSGQTTSAEHRASMHRHYKSAEHETAATAAASAGVAGVGMDMEPEPEPQPEPQVAIEVSEELVGPPGLSGGGASSSPAKLFEDDDSTSDEDAI
jgi:hypothetical protein